MGCCNSRPVPNSDERDLVLKELHRRCLALKQHQSTLSVHLSRLTQIRQQIPSLQSQVHRFTQLHRISALLEQIDETVQAQFVSERLSTNLGEDELVETIKYRQVKKSEKLLREWKTEAETARKSEVSVNTLQKMQGEVQVIATHTKECQLQTKRNEEAGKRTFQGEKSLDFTTWENFSTQTITLCGELLAECDFAHRELSAVVVKLQVCISELELTTNYEQVEELLALLQAEIKPMDRKSYKEISQEVVQFDGITRMSTADSLSHFENFLAKMDATKGQKIDNEKLREVAMRVVEFVAKRRSAYQSGQVSPRPLELDIMEHFNSIYHSHADQQLRDFAFSLRTMDEEKYAKVVARTLGFAPEKQLYYLPKLVKALNDIGREFTWETGGVIHAKEAIELIETWFTSEPHTGSLIIHELSQLFPSPPLFFAFYIQQKMALTRTSASELFSDMDETDQQHLSVPTFASRLKARFSIMAREEDLTILGEGMDKTNSGAVFRTEFLPLFGGKIELEMVECAEVAEAVERAYEEMQGEQTMELYTMYSEELGEQYWIGTEEAERLLARVKPGISPAAIQVLLGKVHSSRLSFEDFRELVWRNNLKSPPDSFFAQPLFCREQFEVSEEVMELTASLSNSE